jgi:hypothetical protein
MSGFHGWYSIGGFVGAGAVTALFGLSLAPWMAMLGVGMVIIALLLVFARHLLPYGSNQKGRSRNGSSRFVFPHGIVIGVGLLCFIAFLAEGSVLDWGAVFMTSRKAVDMAWAGAGYSVFAVLMLIGRLTGDGIVHRLGGSLVLLLGGLGAAAGFGLVILSPWTVLSFIGFGLIGISMANVVPVLYSVLGRQSIMPANQAISAVSTMGYSGILIGPAFIGLVSRLTSLSLALGLVAVLLLTIAASSHLVRKQVS